MSRTTSSIPAVKLPEASPPEHGRLFHCTSEPESRQLDQLLRQVIGNVWSAIGPNESEHLYKNVLKLELAKYLVNVETERSIPVLYDGHIVGSRRVDMIVQMPNSPRKAILELKALGTQVNEEHLRQLLHYMELLGISQGYLVNFPREWNFPAPTGEYRVLTLGPHGEETPAEVPPARKKQRATSRLPQITSVCAVPPRTKEEEQQEDDASE